MPTKRFDLRGKTALITGAAGLLGLEHCFALLECDCNIVLTDIASKPLQNAKTKLLDIFEEADIETFVMDVTSEESILLVSENLKKIGKRVDILINNAAIDPKVSKDSHIKASSRLEDFSINEWDKQISVGLTGAFLCSRVFGKIMAEELKKGIIINIASDLAVIAPDQRIYRKGNESFNNQSVKPITYSVIKNGLIGITKYLSTYWCQDNVRCNALSPGGVFQNQDKDFVDKVTSRIPIGRMANSNEYRGAIQFLCSDASAYMNGHNLIIDGGRSVW